MDPTTAAPDATPAPAAPAAAPTTVSATMDAAAKGDFSAFKAASDAARSGKPLADVSVTPAKAPEAASVPAPDANTPPPAPEPPKPVSKRQEDINERIRVAVERGVSEARAQWEADARRGQPPAPAAAEQPKPSEPAYKRYAAMPDAPKIDDFETVAEHTAAMAYFVAEKMLSERAEQGQRQQTESEMTAAQTARAESFQRQIDAVKGDAAFVAKLTPEVRALKGFGSLLPGEQPGPANFIAEQIYDSPIVDKVLIALAENGNAELNRLMRAPEHVMAMPPSVRVSQHMKWIVREFGKLEARLEQPSTATPAPAPPAAPANHISSAPPPPETLKPASATNTKEAALARGDFSSFHAMETQERIARRQGR